MDINTVSNKKEKIVNIYNKLLELLSPEDRLFTKQRIQLSIDQLFSGEFQVVVMGEIKKGKSSFINAILGEYDLLPTDSDVATSTVYKIKYGPKRKYTVIFNSELSKNQDKEITQEQIWEYGTEKGNPKNEKQVAYIKVEFPNLLLEQGLVIVDTPGVGGLFKQHKKITFEYAPSAEAVLFVIDSIDTVISQQEINFLKDLYKITDHVFFVQTKTDSVDTETWQSWKNRNLSILLSSEELKEFDLSEEKIKYFTVSSKLKNLADENPESEESADDLEESGFVQFNDFIFNQLICEKNKILIKRALNHLIGEIQHYKDHAIDRLENVKENSTQENANKEHQIEKILDKLENWKDESWDNVSSAFMFELSQQTKLCYQKIRDELSPRQFNFKNKLKEIREQYDSYSSLSDNAEEIINNHIASCAEMGNNVTVQYLGNVEKSFYEISKNALSELDLLTKFGGMSISRNSFDLDSSFSYSGAAVDVSGGTIVGAAVAGSMWWALIGASYGLGVVGPGGVGVLTMVAVATPIGWAAIGAVGLLSAVATTFGINKIREKKKINEILGIINIEMERISTLSIENFDSYIKRLEEEIRLGSSKVFETVLTQSRYEVEAMLVDLKKTKKLSEKEIAEEIKKKQVFLDRLTDLLTQLNLMVPHKV